MRAAPGPVEWLTFPAPDDPTHQFRVNVSFMLSNYECIFGRGCPGLLNTTVTTDVGCCARGVTFIDEDDFAHVSEMVDRADRRGLRPPRPRPRPRLVPRVAPRQAVQDAEARRARASSTTASAGRPASPAALSIISRRARASTTRTRSRSSAGASRSTSARSCPTSRAGAPRRSCRRSRPTRGAARTTTRNRTAAVMSVTGASTRPTRTAARDPSTARWSTSSARGWATPRTSAMAELLDAIDGAAVPDAGPARQPRAADDPADRRASLPDSPRE